MSVNYKMSQGGDNYGLNDSFQYFELELDSLDANGITPDGAVSYLDWPLFTWGRPLQSIAAMKVLEVQIPFSWYVFNSANNTFTLTESDGGGARTVTIPVGNYNTSSMIAALQTALDAASANSHTYTVTFAGSSLSAPDTEKFTISSDAGGANTFTLTFGSSISPGNTNPSNFF